MLKQHESMPSQQFQSDCNCQFSSPPPNNGQRQVRTFSSGILQKLKCDLCFQELSQAKKLTDGYEPNRDVEWRVSRSALRAIPTERIRTLATPIVRDTMDHVQFDPLAFQVKESALKGRVSNRIHDLAQPVIRGSNTKK